MSGLRICEPGRHFPARHSSFHRLCPRPDILVTKKRHRRDLAGTMARLAVLLKDRENILIESQGWGVGGRQRPCEDDSNYKRVSTHKALPLRLRFCGRRSTQADLTQNGLARRV